MKTFQSVAVLPFPRDSVARTIRDDLQNLVPLLTDIRAITPVERKKNAGGTLLLVNRWETFIKVPQAVREAAGKPIAWLDYATWTADGNCSWKVEPGLFTERIQCAGQTRFESAMGGRGTRIAFAGSIDVGLSGVASATQLAVISVVEFLAVGVIPRNFQRLAQAARQYLAENER
ncbi:MAG TPA: hypothetical protein VKT72_08125 [Candidatus Baltobacteraceae bacterium]|nr:hypothetical protein [Candidatus Baltobacteraceae bacterium]